MSCNNWEAGTIRFGVGAWRQFKREFQQGFNRIQDEAFAAATRHWEKYRSGPDIHDRMAIVGDRYRFAFLWQKQVQRGNVTFNELRNRPRKPIRNDFPLATNKQTQFDFGEASVTFDNVTREVHYYSGENNHAVDEARHSEVGKLFFRLLGNVTWTRGSGGSLTGNDEYNQDSGIEEGGGGNYVTATFGPKPSAFAARRR